MLARPKCCRWERWRAKVYNSSFKLPQSPKGDSVDSIVGHEKHPAICLRIFFWPPKHCWDHITYHMSLLFQWLPASTKYTSVMKFLKPCSCKCISTSPYLSDNLFSDTQRCTVRLPPQISNWGWSSGHATACKRIGVWLRVTKGAKNWRKFQKISSSKNSATRLGCRRAWIVQGVSYVPAAHMVVTRTSANSWVQMGKIPRNLPVFCHFWVWAMSASLQKDPKDCTRHFFHQGSFI